MSSDNLIRLGQVESGEFISFVNQNASFYPSSDPSGLATEAYIGTVSGDINTKLTTDVGNLHTTGQTLTTLAEEQQGFPTGASGQLQYKTYDGKFGGTSKIFYDYDSDRLGIGNFGAGDEVQESLHVSGNVAISDGNLYVTGDIKQSGISLYSHIESTSGNLHAEVTGASGWIQPDFKVKVVNDGYGNKYWISDVGEETIHGTEYKKAPTLYLHKGNT